MLDTGATYTQTSSQPVSEVAIDRTAVITALKNSGAFFIQFNLGEELIHDVPEFHTDCWNLFTSPGVDRVALALPRGHAKTTLAKLACVYHFLFTPIKFIVYASNTAAIAIEACKDVVNFMRSDNFRSVFGDLEFSVNRDGSGFYEFRLRFLDENGKLVDKSCILRAIGAGQQVRGLNIRNTRPELAVIDDLEDDDNTATTALQKKLFRWLYGPFLKALSRKVSKVIYLGNMLSGKSILYDIVEKAQDWWSRRYGCLKSDGKPLWPELWSLEAIKADLIAYQRKGLVAVWFAEMMNLPIAEGGGIIEPGAIPYADFIVPGDHEAAFLTIDPAISKETWANSTSIVVHALRNGIWVIAEQLTGKLTPDETFFYIVSACLRWNTRVVGIEKGGYQIALQYIFRTLMIVHNQHFNVYEIPHKNKSKTERLLAWCSLLRQRIWALQLGDYAVTEQLLAYDPLKKDNNDDLIDACSMGATMVNMFLPNIMIQHTPVHVRQTPFLGLQACPN